MQTPARSLRKASAKRAATRMLSLATSPAATKVEALIAGATKQYGKVDVLG